MYNSVTNPSELNYAQPRNIARVSSTTYNYVSSQTDIGMFFAFEVVNV